MIGYLVLTFKYIGNNQSAMFDLKNIVQSNGRFWSVKKDMFCFSEFLYRFTKNSVLNTIISLYLLRNIQPS